MSETADYLLQQAMHLSPEVQHELAAKIAANVGMMLVNEPEHPDSPHADTRKTYRIEHDGFVGVQIGAYRTLEGKEGVVLQQTGTRVVHVYGRIWLVPSRTL